MRHVIGPALCVLCAAAFLWGLVAIFPAQSRPPRQLVPVRIEVPDGCTLRVNGTERATLLLMDPTRTYTLESVRDGRVRVTVSGFQPDPHAGGKPQTVRLGD